MPDAGLLRGKRGLIMGLANNRSIAWGIAKAARAHGAELAFTYQGDAFKKRVRAGVLRKCSIRGIPYWRSSTLTPHQMFVCVAYLANFVRRSSAIRSARLVST